MICDNFRVTGAHDTILDYADLFSVTLHDDNIQEFDTRWDDNVQEFDTRWDEVLLLCQRYRLMMFWKVCTNGGYESLRNSKIVLELYEREIHQKISMPNYQKINPMVKRSSQKLDTESHSTL